MTEDKFQRIRADYRGFGMVVYDVRQNSVIAVGNTHKKLSEQLDSSEYSLSDENLIILRCETDEFV